MIYHPQKYRIEDKPMTPFIDAEEIWDYIKNTPSDKARVKDVIDKALDKQRLSLAETAVLINATAPGEIEQIKEGAHRLKEKIYGERIVLFAPLYIGNLCTNNCQYCGFRTDNKHQRRLTLSHEQIVSQVESLEDNGHKRLILVFGEHPQYTPEFIADTVKTVYKVKKGQGEIRRVNINAAPLSLEGFKAVHEAGIGTYQIFQETYHPETYAKVHLGGKKRDFDHRLTALDCAQEAGIDDVGIGALFGLYDWRFEVLGLLRHVNHFEAVYNVGPHTISFPRIQNASELAIDKNHLVNNADFTRLVAILRLAVPYTGMILTAREPVAVRQEVMRFGVSQIDGGTNIEMEGYTKHDKKAVQDLNASQFEICDPRPLSEIIEELLDTGYLPSFCTACYRLGRTGEHFMEFSVPGFIKRYCGPNAALTLAEYLEDYATPEVKQKGYKLIEEKMANGEMYNVETLRKRIERIKQGERDLYF